MFGLILSFLIGMLLGIMWMCLLSLNADRQKVSFQFGKLKQYLPQRELSMKKDSFMLIRNEERKRMTIQELSIQECLDLMAELDYEIAKRGIEAIEKKQT